MNKLKQVAIKAKKELENHKKQVWITALFLVFNIFFPMTDRKFHRKGRLSLNSRFYIEEENTVLSGDLSQILQPPPADDQYSNLLFFFSSV